VSAEIDGLVPVVANTLTDGQIADHYQDGSRANWLRANFVASIDGAATVEGKSAELGGDADRRVFDLLRTLCDVVLVGAGTVRIEGYGALRLDEASVAARVERGLEPQPRFAIVSSRLDLDPAAPVFTDAKIKPVLITSAAAPKKALDALSEVADVVVVGEASVDLTAAVSALEDRGLTRIHCEGGPTLFASLLAADLVDELCLTVSPLLVAGDARRITRGDIPQPRNMDLAGVLRSERMLLLRYLRDRT
jgi:riboflavin-specific deaminase-like protein